ncbi:MAG: DNA primase [Actinobacteria bacterium]|nr:DNA primase [Actinomycetota bacterium]
MGIVDEDIERVRSATDIVALITERVPLKRSGRRWVGLCPFHEEKTPSFSVNAEDGLYYCFGCGAGGDAITFVRDTEHLSFAEAVERLAARAKITLHYDARDARQQGQANKREVLLDALDRAVSWYHEQLLKAPEARAARDYLRSRGYDGKVVRAFRLGWAPDEWDALSRHLALSDEIFVKAGLGFVNRSGRQQDAMRSRIIFPICDPAGRAIALAGRVISGNSLPKYKNSPEGPLYLKRRTLYGFNWAKEAIASLGEAIVCEGYTDVIAFHSIGLRNAVATCGTALTDEHLQLLARYSKRVLLAYDGDRAGQEAVMRIHEWERTHELSVEVVQLPPGEDPASLAAHDPDALRKAVGVAKPYLAFRLERVLASYDMKTAESRARAARAGLELLVEHPDDLVRDQYLVSIADRCRFDLSKLRSSLAELLTLSRDSSFPRSKGAKVQMSSGKPTKIRDVDTYTAGGSWPGSKVPRESLVRSGGERSMNRAYRVRNALPAVDERLSDRTALYPYSSRDIPGPELAALRLAVHRPGEVADRLEEVLFSNQLCRRTFNALASAESLQEAVAKSDEEVARLITRIAVEEVEGGLEAADVLDRLLISAARRQLARLETRARAGLDAGAFPELASATAWLRKRIEELSSLNCSQGLREELLQWLMDNDKEEE